MTQPRRLGAPNFPPPHPLTLSLQGWAVSRRPVGCGWGAAEEQWTLEGALVRTVFSAGFLPLVRTTAPGRVRCSRRCDVWRGASQQNRQGIGYLLDRRFLLWREWIGHVAVDVDLAQDRGSTPDQHHQLRLRPRVAG